MIYVSTSCVKGEYIKDTIVKYAHAGIKNIELSGGTKYYKELEDDIYKLKKQYGLNYACHAYFPPPIEDFVINLASCNDDIYIKSIKYYEHCIEMLKRLEINTLSIHAGFIVEILPENIGRTLNCQVIYPKEKAYNRFVKAYNHINDLCKENDICLYLENNVLSEQNYKIFGYKNFLMMTDCNSIKDMKDKLKFNLLLDLAHLNVSSNSLGLDFCMQAKELLDMAKWIHLSENDGVIDQHKLFDKKDNSKILSLYKKYKRNDINVTLETKGEIEQIIQCIDLLR